MPKHRRRKNQNTENKINVEEELSNPYFLPDEIWGEVFKNLSPLFINAVLNTSRKFKSIGEASLLNGPVKFQEQKTTFFAWKKDYRNLIGWRSSHCKTLLNFVAYEDYAQIEGMSFDPSSINAGVLTEINEYDNQFARDVIFKGFYAWFKAKAEANYGNFFIFFGSYFVDFSYLYFEYESEFKLMDLAVVLNQVELVKRYLPYLRSDGKIWGAKHLRLACSFGFIAMVEVMLGEDNFVKKSLAQDKNLLLDIIERGDNCNIVKLLLRKSKEFDKNTLKQAVIEMIDLNKDEMLSAFFSSTDVITQLSDELVDLFRYAYQQEERIEAAKIIGSVYQVIVAIIAKNDVVLLRSLLSLELNFDALLPGQTLLHVAAANHADKVIKHLLDEGANPFARNFASRTPLDLALKHKKWGAQFGLYKPKVEGTVALLVAEQDRRLQDLNIQAACMKI